MKIKKIFIVVNLIIICVLVLITFVLAKDTLGLYEIYQDLRFSFQVLRDPSIQADGRTFIETPFIDFTLDDIYGKAWSLHDDKAKMKIIILFNTDDCAGCLEEYRLWKKIDEIYADDLVSIVGINNDKSKNNLNSFIKTREIRFLVLHDPDNIIKKSMGFRFSPLRIILNDKNRIIDVEKSGGSLTKQKEILSYISSKLKKFRE